MRVVLILASCLAGCALVPDVADAPDVSDAVVVDAQDAPTRPQARPNTADPEVPAIQNGAFGTTIASLGNPAEPGLWLKTPLTSVERPGSVTSRATGQSTAVTLIPIDGPRSAGSRMSLAAMQAISAPLGDLIELDVFGF